jgi:beta-galactosidase/beta-glucuronidase
MVQERFEIVVGDVTDMEAHVRARYVGPEHVTLGGTVRGPFCEKGRTLPATFPFRQTEANQPNMAEAVVTDPCMWTPEMPHSYRVELQAMNGDTVIDEYDGTIGLRRLAPRRPVDFAPGTG